MKKLIERKMDEALIRGQLPDSILDKMGSKVTRWGHAPKIDPNKLEKMDKNMVSKLKRVPWQEVYAEWPKAPAAANFDREPPSMSFVVVDPSDKHYLISTEGYKYARYVARIS